MVVTDAEIERALATVAVVIERHGDAYWPIFERLERELALRKQRKERLAHFARRSDLTVLPPP